MLQAATNPRAATAVTAAQGHAQLAGQAYAWPQQARSPSSKPTHPQQQATSPLSRASSQCNIVFTPMNRLRCAPTLHVVQPITEKSAPQRQRARLPAANTLPAASTPPAASTRTLHVVQVAPRVKLEVGANADPQVAAPPRAPGLQHQTRHGAALAHARAVADEEAAAAAVGQHLGRGGRRAGGGRAARGVGWQGEGVCSAGWPAAGGGAGRVGGSCIGAESMQSPNGADGGRCEWVG